MQYQLQFCQLITIDARMAVIIYLSIGISHPWGWFPLPRFFQVYIESSINYWNKSDSPSQKTSNQQSC